LEKAFEIFKVMKQKDQKFAALVAGWNKEVILQHFFNFFNRELV